MSYAAALLLTLLVEVPMYSVGLRALLSMPTGRGAAAAVVINCVTHPLAFLAALPMLRGVLPLSAALAVVEAVVWLAEAAMLWTWVRRDAVVLLGLSLAANGTSLVTGVVLLR